MPTGLSPAKLLIASLIYMRSTEFERGVHNRSEQEFYDSFNSDLVSRLLRLAARFRFPPRDTRMVACTRHGVEIS